MKFGKREQRVIVGVGGLLSIGALHMMVFSARNQFFQESITARATAQDAIQGGIATIRNPGMVTKMNEESAKLNEEYGAIVKGLEIKRHPAFVMPAPDPKASPEDQAKVLDEKHAEQVQAFVEEVQKLLEFDAKRGGKRNGKTDMAFFGPAYGNGWKLPLQLPNVGEGVMRDLLSDLDGTLRIIDGIDKAQTDLISKQRAYYEAQLTRLGVDNAMYKDPNEETSLRAQGESVPLIHKIVHAMLIEKAVENDPQWKGQIWKLLEIQPPKGPMKPLAEMEMYFLYEQLVRLNATLELMVKNEVSQVFGVILENPKYLEKMEKLADFDEKSEGSWKQGRPPAGPSPWVLNFARDPGLNGKNAPVQLEVLGPDMATDIGFVTPIVVQFKASNAAGWRVIHDVLNSFPMAEVDQMSMVGDRSSDSGEVYWQVRFSFVLLLFKVQS